MTYWLLCMVLVAAGLAGGCATPTSSVSSASTVPSTPSKADEFFSDPKVAALARALERNDWPGAQTALRGGADVNAIGKDAITLPAWAMYIKSKKAFEWLFDHGANPNLDPGQGRGPLILAVRVDDSDWLRILLAHKANPNLVHKDSIDEPATPLMELVIERRLTNLKMLIAAGADVNYQLPKDSHQVSWTATLYAAQLGWYEGTYALLQAGADIRPNTVRGRDLTYLIVERNQSADLADPFRAKILQLLRERGADVDGAMKKVSEKEAQFRKDNAWRYR